MKRTPLALRRMPDYTRGEEICNMVTHIVRAGHTRPRAVPHIRRQPP